jgi:hypothetical protein
MVPDMAAPPEEELLELEELDSLPAPQAVKAIPRASVATVGTATVRKGVRFTSLSPVVLVDVNDQR